MNNLGTLPRRALKRGESGGDYVTNDKVVLELLQIRRVCASRLFFLLASYARSVVPMLLDLLMLISGPLLQEFLAHRAKLRDEKFFGIVGALKLRGFVFDHIKKSFDTGLQSRMSAQSFF